MVRDIPFNKPFIIGPELYYMALAVLAGRTAGGGPYAERCERLIERTLGAPRALLTTSCGSAFEMASLLCDLAPGDEVILPSFGGAAAANAFLGRGAKLVFADIRADTLNLDETQLDGLVGERTRVIVARHHAGVACDMAVILPIARRRGILVIEDAADAFGARCAERALGTLGDFGAMSFHETRAVMGGDAGALLVGAPKHAERAEVIREKGTDRARFFRGEIDKYAWVDIGSSYVPSDLAAAFLFAQLERLDDIVARGIAIHAHYREALAGLADRGLLALPAAAPDADPRHHGFFVLVRDEPTRAALIEHLAREGIMAVVHFSALHTSAMGRRLGYAEGMLPVTEDISRRVVRLPFYHELTAGEIEQVAGQVLMFFGQND